MQPLEQCQKIDLPQGAIYLGESNSTQSVGYLELNPHTSLTLHNRPAIEKLTQVKHTGQIVLYKENQGEVITFEEGDHFVIEPANTWHIHTNPFDTVSLTYWDFEGDITEIIENIRSMAE